MDFISITIDGPAGAGKSTVAKKTAEVLKFKSLNVGQIYRGIAYKYLINTPPLTNETEIDDFVKSLDVIIRYDDDNNQHTFVDCVDVTVYLHEPRINQIVSLISPYKQVRSFVIKIQRELASRYNIVVEGRDVGTNVLPDAQFKFFITADVNARALRRFKELINGGQQNIEYNKVIEEIIERDEHDTHRVNGAMRIPNGAYIVDTTNKKPEEVIEFIVSIVRINN